MSAAWMLQAALAAALLGVGALAAERVAGWFGAPRRAVWAAAMLGSLGLAGLSLAAPRLLPAPGVLRVPAPAVHLPGIAAAPLDPAAPPAAAAAPTARAAHAAPGASPAWWSDLRVPLSLGWLAASLAMLGVVGWTYRRLRRVCARGLRAELEGAEVRVVEGVGPCVVGLVHPEVVVPRWVLDVTAEERRLVLLHEREHVAAGDAWLLFLGTLAVAAMPWCPALWWQHRRLRAAVEADCDARVLARGAARRVYGQVLIRTAGSTPGLPLLGPAWGDSTSQLERRIIDMTAKRPTHRLLRSAPLLALAAAVATTACDVLAGAEAEASISTDPASVRVAVEARLGVAAPERFVDTVPLPRALAPLPPMEPAAFPPLPALEAAAPLPPQDPPAPAGAVLPALAAPPAPEPGPAPAPAPAAPPPAEAPAVRPAPADRPTPPVLLAPALAPAPEARPAPDAPRAPAARPAPDSRMAPAAPPLPPTASAGWELSRRRTGDAAARPEFRRVTRLRLDGGAWRAGVREGDEVIAVDGRDGRLDSSVIALLYKRPGTSYTLRFRRGGVEREVIAQVDPAHRGAPRHF